MWRLAAGLAPPLLPPPCISPALNFWARMLGSKEASFSLRSVAPFLGDPVWLGEFSADFLLLSSSLAIETSRSKPMLISSRQRLASSGAEPSPEDEAGLEGFLPGVGDTRGEAARFLESSGPVWTGRSGV